MDEIALEQGIERDDLEVWFGDEARIGQKNKITRRWAKRDTRPSAPHDQRTASTYIFGAICPQEGKAAGLILPWCNTQAMNLHLAEISAHVPWQSLHTPATVEMAAAVRQARSRQVAARASDVLAVVRQVQAEEASSLRIIAAELHAHGVLTPAGKLDWPPAQVRRLLSRGKQLCSSNKPA